MDITEVRIKLMEDSEDRLRAFCSITIDQSFVVRDLKIIDGANGPFVAMPSRKLTGRCHRCGFKNHLRCNYCNQCGSKMRTKRDSDGYDSSPNKLYADIAHPINQACRDLIQRAVIIEYEEELKRAQQPGYVSRYDDDYSESVDPPAQRDAEPSAEPSTTTTAENDVPPVDVPQSDSDQKNVAQADTESRAAPRRPHFDAKPNRQRVNSEENDDDAFGAGIM